MKKLYHSVITFAVTIAMLACSGCGSSLYENHKENYTKVTSVEGVTFDMPENFLAQATAITSISDEEDYSTNTYLFKDGKSIYLMFNIGQVVVAVENQTCYRLKDATNIENAIENESLDGIWIKPQGKSLSYETEEKDGVYKLMATVKGDVSVTTETYGLFAGKFTYVSVGDYECSMFVGVRGESYDSLDSNAVSIIEHISKSLTVTDIADSLTSSDSTQADTEASNQNTSETGSEPVIDEATEAVEEIPEMTESTEAVGVQDTEAIVELPTETVNEPETEIVESTEIEVPEADVENNTDNVGNENRGFTVKDNQGTTGTKYSDIYHLLKIGETGLYHAYDKDAENSLSDGEITIEQLYTGDEAVNIIKEYCNSGKSMYKYTDAPVGYSWHVVRYSLSKSQNELYTNIKIEGLDGERLKYRGISCTTRTYDIIYDWDGTTDLYCYYAVPNGCKEYMLECGNRYESTSETACFKILGY